MKTSPTRGSTGPLAPRPALVMTLAFWAVVYGIYTLRSVLVPVPFEDQLLPRVINCAFGAFLCGVLYFALRSQLHRRPWQLLAFGAAGSLLGALLYNFVSMHMYDLFITYPPEQRMTPEEERISLLLGAQTYLWVFLSWCFGFLALVYNERSRANELRMLEAQALAADAQNRMLRYQINPHFLFNTLNTLSSFVLEKKVDKAEETLLSLSEFLRYSLARSPDEMVPLREEVAAQEDYLNIERARFGDRVTFVVEVAPEVSDALLPSLILQPLVENAVKYAVSASSKPVTIELTARLEHANAVISVRDDGQPTGPKPGLGVGLENVRRRLELAFGAAATFRHGPRPGGGYEVVITVPVGSSRGAMDAAA
ncbi:MAG TPA: histidine kinase [Caulobacteraceae bacterium]|nr:histidine kinase [Caulobacteraceae bacterium]